jgi:RimJ/RimL family protein N-acetyltransferase
MAGPTFLESERVSLCPLEEEDLEFCVQQLNDPDVRQGLAIAAPMNMHQEREWFESMSEDDTDVVLAICRDGEIMGTTGLHDVNERFGNAELGYWLAAEYHGNGYATEAAELLAGYSFAERRLHKLYAHVFDFNDASRRVLEKVGFEREGVFREQAFVDGEYVDLCRYGLLAREWRGTDDRL